jgi:hypothetical protein
MNSATGSGATARITYRGYTYDPSTSYEQEQEDAAPAEPIVDEESWEDEGEAPANDWDGMAWRDEWDPVQAT